VGMVITVELGRCGSGLLAVTYSHLLTARINGWPGGFPARAARW
jgi:hypothetical protein